MWTVQCYQICMQAARKLLFGDSFFFIWFSGIYQASEMLHSLQQISSTSELDCFLVWRILEVLPWLHEITCQWDYQVLDSSHVYSFSRDLPCIFMKQSQPPNTSHAYPNPQPRHFQQQPKNEKKSIGTVPICSQYFACQTVFEQPCSIFVEHQFSCLKMAEICQVNLISKVVSV